MFYQSRIGSNLLAFLLTVLTCATNRLSGAEPEPPKVAPTVAPAASPDSSAPLPEAAKEPRPADSPAPTLTVPAQPAESSVLPSENATINLIRRLVKRGVLTQEDADELIKMAEADAAKGRAQNVQPAQSAVTASDLLPPAALIQGAPQSAPEPTPPPLPQLTAGPDAVRVTYIPEMVKNQLRDEIKDELIRGGYAATDGKGLAAAPPPLYPDWVSRVKLFGDLRVRYEGDFYPGGNDNTGAFPNFNAINTGSPFDASTTSNVRPPTFNVDTDRNRFRIRGRLGLSVDLGEGFTLGFRGATGENDSPVTENQSLGVANGGQGGNFSKYAIWLDRAFLRYELGGQPDWDFSLTVGRQDNPFFSTTMLWATDLGFDGAVAQGKYQLVSGVTPFLTVGAFPVFNTDFNFSSTNAAKFSSNDKYLYAIQGGVSWKINRDFNLKLGLAYYYFQNVEGKLSDPFTPLTASDGGNTDDSRPAFAQNGNTYMALRNIVPTAANNFNQIDQFQYYGLATPFRDFVLTGRLEYNHFEPIQVSLTGEYVNNTAFDRDAIESKAVNNRASAAFPAVGSYAGGNTGWILNLTVGSVVLQKRWDWNVNFGYRYVESDAVIDGFTDSDFGGATAGANLKGYTLSGNLALSPNVWLGIRWMSADQIAGPPLKDDVLQIDINGKF
jgi:Putative porin